MPFSQFLSDESYYFNKVHVATPTYLEITAGISPTKKKSKELLSDFIKIFTSLR